CGADIRAIVGETNVVRIAGVEVDAAAQVHGVGARAVDVLADLADARVEVDEHGHAVLDAGVAQAAAIASQGGAAARVVLHRERKSVRGVVVRVHQKRVGGGETSDALLDVPPGTAGLEIEAVGQAEGGAVERRCAAKTLKRQAVRGGEATRIIRRRGIGPLPNVLDGGGPTGAGGKADVRGAVPHDTGQIHAGERRAECTRRVAGVGHCGPELGAVVGETNVVRVAGVEVDAAAQV